MLSDPISVTFGGSARSLPRVGNTAQSAVYRSSDGLYVAKTFQSPSSKGTRYRRGISFSTRKIAADPFVTGVNSEFSQAVTVSVNVPVVGYTSAETVDAMSGLMAFLQASSAEMAIAIATGQI